MMSDPSNPNEARVEPGEGEDRPAEQRAEQASAPPHGQPPAPEDGRMQPPQPTPPSYSPPPVQAPPPGFSPPQAPHFGPPPVEQAQPAAPQYQPPQAPPGFRQPQSLPQAPVPQGAPGYAQPQYPAPAHQQAPPAGAPRRGLPVGAWIGIGAGALVFLLVIGIGATMLVGALLRPTPAPIVTPLPSPEEDLGDEDPFSDNGGELLSLDDTADFAAGPYWMTPFPDGWEIVTFDVEGVNEFTHTDTGCRFFSYQGYGAEGVDASGDREASEATIPTALQIGIPWEATADPDVVPDGTVEVMANYSYPVEMMRLVADYQAPGGDRQRQMLLRTFMPGNLALYAEVDCPATAAGGDAATEMFEGLGITDF